MYFLITCARVLAESAGVLAEFLLRYLHSGMGERSVKYKKIVEDVGGLILVYIC